MTVKSSHAIAFVFGNNYYSTKKALVYVKVTMCLVVLFLPICWKMVVSQPVICSVIAFVLALQQSFETVLTVMYLCSLFKLLRSHVSLSAS